VSCEIKETKALETLHDPSGLYPVYNPQTSVSFGIEETKTFETLHDPSGWHPVWNPQTFKNCEVEETKTLKVYTQSGNLKLPRSAQ
jgi:hypothetical protein